MDYIRLADAMALLREELAEAQDAAWDQQMRFEVTEAEIEFLVELRSEAGGEAKANFGVIAIGGNLKGARTDAHRLRLKLNIKDAAAEDRHVDIKRTESRSWEE